MAEATTTYSERAAQMDAYVAEIPFPDGEPVHFRNHPDEVDYLMGKGAPDMWAEARCRAQRLALDAADFARDAKRETSVTAQGQFTALAQSCALASLALSQAFREDGR